MELTTKQEATRWGRGLAVAMAATLFAFGAASPAQADVQIQFSGLDLQYNGATIFDAGGIAGGLGVQATSDPLITMTFILNPGPGQTVLGTLTSNIWADIIIPIGALTLDGTATGSGGIFDLLTNTNTPGWGLALNNISYTITTDFQAATTPPQLNVLGSGTLNQIFSQNLPFGLVVGQPVTWAFSSSAFAFTSLGTNLLTFTAGGTGVVKAGTVAEPASLALLALGLIGVAGFARRRIQ